MIMGFSPTKECKLREKVNTVKDETGNEWHTHPS